LKKLWTVGPAARTRIGRYKEQPMKKALSIICIAAVVCAIGASCVSATLSFDTVYIEFRSELDLTNAKSHKVVRGETLSGITKDYYGDDFGYYFPMIMGASSRVVTHPDKIVPGMVLTIPDKKRNLANPIIRANIRKQFLRVAGIYRREGNNFVADRLVETANSL
jgi:hypothetical protein